ERAEHRHLRWKKAQRVKGLGDALRAFEVDAHRLTRGTAGHGDVEIHLGAMPADAALADLSTPTIAHVKLRGRLEVVDNAVGHVEGHRLPLEANAVDGLDDRGAALDRRDLDAGGAAL